MPDESTGDFTPLQHRYLDVRFTALEGMFREGFATQASLAAAAKESADEATRLAAELARHNQEIGNQYREQLREQAATFATIQEVRAMRDNLDSKQAGTAATVATVQQWQAAHVGGEMQKSEERGRIRGGVEVAIALAGLLIALAVYLSR